MTADRTLEPARRGLVGTVASRVHLRSVAFHQVLSVPASLLGGGLWLALTDDRRYRVDPLLWLLGLGAVLVAQLLLAGALLRASRQRGSRPASPVVAGLYAIAIADGSIWGVIPILLHPQTMTWDLWLLTVLFLLAITAGALGSMQGVRGLFATLVVPLWLPACVTLWALHDRRTNLLLLGVITLIGLLVYFSTHGNRVTRELAELQEHHAELVDKLRLSEERFRSLASRDPLTGLRNRHGFSESLEARLTQGRLWNFPVHLLVIDLDRFKGVNDDHGHAAGDRLLAAASERIERILDEANGDAAVARWGGDEFVACISGLDDDVVEALVAQLEDALGQPFEVGSHTTVTVGASIGTARARTDETFAELFVAADRGMYLAKQSREAIPTRQVDIGAPQAELPTPGPGRASR